MKNNIKQPKVSVLIPIYKRDEYLFECINSVLNQTLKDIEIILIDRGDKDACGIIIDYFANIDDRIRVSHINNNGYGAACNIGFKMAKGEYVCIVESDDSIEKTMCERMYLIGKKLDADIVKAPYYDYFGNYKKICEFKSLISPKVPKNRCFSIFEFGDLLNIHASIWSAIYKTEYIKKNKIFFVEADGAGYVDVGFRVLSLLKTKKICWIDEPFYNYRVNANESSTSNWKIDVMIKRWQENVEFIETLSSNIQDYLYKYLVLDMYMNLVSPFYCNICNVKQVKEVREIFLRTKINFKKRIEYLDKNQINQILLIIEKPDMFYYSLTSKKCQKRTKNIIKRLINSKKIPFFIALLCYSISIVFLSLNFLNYLGKKSYIYISIVLSLVPLLYVFAFILMKIFRFFKKK